MEGSGQYSGYIDPGYGARARLVDAHSGHGAGPGAHVLVLEHDPDMVQGTVQCSTVQYRAAVRGGGWRHLAIISYI